MFRIICMIAAICLHQNIKAQDFTYFNKTYGGNDTINMLAQAVQPIEDGYLVLGGYGAVGYNALYVCKIDHEGTMQWLKNIEVDTTNTIGVIEHGGFIHMEGAAIVVTYAKYLPSKDICISKVNLICVQSLVVGRTCIYPRLNLGNIAVLHFR